MHVRDLSIIKGKGVVNPRLQFLQGACNFEYLMHLYDIFQTYCGTPGGVPLRFLVIIINKRVKGMDILALIP
jgi:hypothetical protein